MKISRTSQGKAHGRPGRPPSQKKPETEDVPCRCVRCGKEFRKQVNNFPLSQSPLWEENNGRVPICYLCVDELYRDYTRKFQNDKDAIERICMKLDYYWNTEIYDTAARNKTAGSRIRAYITRVNQGKYAGKTYDDTIEEGRFELPPKVVVEEEPDESANYLLNTPVASLTSVEAPTEDTILFWGAGFTADFYHELNLRYEKWTGSLPKPLDLADEALYKQICIQECIINRNISRGEAIVQNQNILNTLLGSLNIKPVQKKEDEAAGDTDSTPLGVWAKRWEDKRPIPEDTELDQENKIIKYINVWFYGHLGKMLGMKNIYSPLYEAEIGKYTVERPEFEGEDDDVVIDEVFGGEEE